MKFLLFIFLILSFPKSYALVSGDRLFCLGESLEIQIYVDYVVDKKDLKNPMDIFSYTNQVAITHKDQTLLFDGSILIFKQANGDYLFDILRFHVDEWSMGGEPLSTFGYWKYHSKTQSLSGDHDWVKDKDYVKALRFRSEEDSSDQGVRSSDIDAFFPLKNSFENLLCELDPFKKSS